MDKKWLRIVFIFVSAMLFCITLSLFLIASQLGDISQQLTDIRGKGMFSKYSENSGGSLYGIENQLDEIQKAISFLPFD